MNDLFFLTQFTYELFMKGREMQIPDEQKFIPLRCYVVGKKETLTLEEAYVLFWIYPFAWLLALDWYRYKRIQAYMRDIATKSARVFLMQLLTRQYLVLTIDDECMRDRHGDPPGPNAFAAKAHRLRKIFRNQAAPFIYEDALIAHKGTVQAYRMKPGQKWLVVVGVDPKSGFTDCDVDWTLFQEKPDRTTRDAVIGLLKKKRYL